jgi:hypothetical protein
VEGEALIQVRFENGPPPALEKFVLCLIPPAARESVAGDLCEMYRAPGQYARDALRAIPFIVASQVRRSANLPVLGLQGLLLFSWFGGLAGSAAFAAIATATIVAGLAVLEAYRGSGRPSVQGAIVMAVLAGAGAELCALAAAHLLRPDLHAMAYFAFFGPLMVPVLCLLRTALILWSDRSRPQVTRVLSPGAVMDDYRGFARRTAWQCRGEAGALAGVALVLAGLPGMLGAVIVLYLLAALYLLLDGEAPSLPQRANLAGVQALFRQELARQHRLRSLVWWLWFVPLFLQMQTGLGGGHRPLSILEGIALALLAGFFVESLNRERRGRVQEEIGSLAAERPVSRFNF